ncbi:hypothetical protein [Campylobacter rectus]|nr:hypothetical protein [Campylobacter rectus]
MSFGIKFKHKTVLGEADEQGQREGAYKYATAACGETGRSIRQKDEPLF